MQTALVKRVHLSMNCEAYKFETIRDRLGQHKVLGSVRKTPELEVMRAGPEPIFERSVRSFFFSGAKNLKSGTEFKSWAF